MKTKSKLTELACYREVIAMDIASAAFECLPDPDYPEKELALALAYEALFREAASQLIYREWRQQLEQFRPRLLRRMAAAQKKSAK